MGNTNTFYINLDARTDRRLHIEAQLARSGVSAERFKAVTPADIDPAHIAIGQRNGVSPGELACSLSHRRIWELIIARGLTGALIIEDDALLSSRLNEITASPDLHTRVDALHLEARLSRVALGGALPGEGPALHRLLDTCLGTCAYYITTEFAARLLARPDLDLYPIDKLLFGRQGGLIYEARIYQCIPGLAAQLGMYSDGSASAARSDLTPIRQSRQRRHRSLRGRLDAIATGWRYFARSVVAFAPSGELFRARRRPLPLADDITAQL